jgi:hypothetical protein
MLIRNTRERTDRRNVAPRHIDCIRGRFFLIRQKDGSTFRSEKFYAIKSMRDLGAVTEYHSYRDSMIRNPLRFVTFHDWVIAPNRKPISEPREKGGRAGCDSGNPISNVPSAARIVGNWCCHEKVTPSLVFRWLAAECPPASTPQQPLIAAPKISSVFRLLKRNANSFRYSGRYFLLTL